MSMDVYYNYIDVLTNYFIMSGNSTPLFPHPFCASISSAKVVSRANHKPLRKTQMIPVVRMKQKCPKKPEVPPSGDEEVLEEGEALSSRSDPKVPPSEDEEMSQEVEPESHPEVLPDGDSEVAREVESTSSNSHPEVPSSKGEELPRENEDFSSAPP
ncbi:hypothetical protein ACFE04_021601 [Oxalis oulophora]